MSLRRNLPVGVEQPQILETQVRHELALRRLAIQQHQLLGDGGNDGRLREILAGKGNIRKRARLAVEIPLAGRIQCLGHVLDKVADAAAPVIERPWQRALEGDDAICFVQRRNPLMPDLPGLIDDDHCVIEVARPLDVARLEAEGDLAAGGRFAGLRVGDRRGLPGRIEEAALVRHPRPGPPLAVDPQGGESPLAGLDLGEVGHPPAALLPPTGDLPAAGDDRPIAGIARVRDGVLLAAGIRRLEDERFDHGILAASDEDANWLPQRPGGFDLANGVPRAAQRCPADRRFVTRSASEACRSRRHCLRAKRRNRRQPPGAPAPAVWR